MQQAADLAMQIGAELDIVSAFEPVPKSRLREERPTRRPISHTRSARARMSTPSLPKPPRSSSGTGVKVNTFARQGDPADAILDVAEENKADLIMVGNKGMTGAKRFLLGSVPNKVSHHAPSSVLIVRTT